MVLYRWWLFLKMKKSSLTNVDTCELESNSNDYEIMGSKWALERPQTSSLGSKYKGQMHGARCAWNGENLYISKSIYTTKRGGNRNDSHAFVVSCICIHATELSDLHIRWGLDFNHRHRVINLEQSHHKIKMHLSLHFEKMCLLLSLSRMEMGCLRSIRLI